MSLKDTIKGAREEASANVSSRAAKPEAGETTEAKAANTGFSRRSAANSKPARRKAAGVRVVNADGQSKSKAQMTKEERKAENRRKREMEDQRFTLSQAILKENDEYNRLYKKWTRLLIAGIVLLVLALTFYGIVSQQGETAPTWMAAIALASMVASYGVIIYGLVFDWRKIRPIRNEVDKRVESMSIKRVRAALAKRA